MMSPEIIFEIHQRGIELYGGAPNVIDSNCPERSWESAQSAAYYSSLQTTQRHPQGNNSPVISEALTVAGYLCYYLTRNHCFLDGNKRVGWAAAMKVLEQGLNMTINASDDEVYAFMLGVADSSANDISGEHVIEWMAQRLAPLDYVQPNNDILSVSDS